MINDKELKDLIFSIFWIYINFYYILYYLYFIFEFLFDSN